MSDASPCENTRPGYPLQGAACGKLTFIHCVVCGRPVCAECSEASWIEECPETCPFCWNGEEELTP